MAGAGLRQIEQMLTYRRFDYVSTQKAAYGIAANISGKLDSA
ncbi:MAG: hypothetical protein QOF64_177 [Candidatus Binatota bacterium]|jgi:hypothetical protein|nr:hypothetical protein [Candidatus Binatota bacterium]